MENPCLVNGRKFDLRYFMLIACTKPYLVLTNTGYARISLEDYNLTGLDFKTKEDRARHLTNASVQKFHPKYKEEKAGSIWSFDKLGDYFVDQGKVNDKGEFHRKVSDNCDEICRLLFSSVSEKLERKFGCFELFGLDFMLDEDLNPQLIEINTNPAIFTDTPVQKDLVPKLVDDTLKLAIQLHQPGATSADVLVEKFMEE
jgi:hypothetical protein